MLNFLNKVISISFYAIFLVVPLTFAGDTSELFELNKMWLTYALAIMILVAWISKMLIQKRIFIQRTPLDIPLLLFLASQIISSVWSLDSYVSFWGYYSRFNGGLLSTITYIFLYYALASNINVKQIIRCLYVSIAAGVLVSLWGLPSHFGYDPTCLVFRGTFDVSCWTNAFQPKVRIFSTLGQPDWLSAYLVMLTPLAFAFGVYYAKLKKTLYSFLFFAITLLFYVDNLFTRSKSGMLGMVAAMVLLIGWYAWTERKIIKQFSLINLVKTHLYSLITLGLIVVFSFFIGTGISQIDKFGFSGLQQIFQSHTQQRTTQSASAASSSAAGGGELSSITDSGKIRLYVWKGALETFFANPIFGTGVETFAYAYYLHRPAGHNLTSEWDYLYNKAHNEFLNYLATTGIVGFGTYMTFIIMFLFVAGKRYYQKVTEKTQLSFLTIPALLASFISILITNFFGFSVVTINTYFFLIPIFVFFLEDLLPNASVVALPKTALPTRQPSGFQWIGIIIFAFVGFYFIYVLIQYRTADIAYALGQNLDNVGQYQQAYATLHTAVQLRPDEPVFQDELSLNDAVLASDLASQNNATVAAKLAQEAITTSDTVVANHPNSVVYWKTRVRVAYLLAQLNSQYIQVALQAIQKAQQLSPTDAKVSYNLGILYGQTGQLGLAVATLQNTVALKSDYQDAYYALGAFYHQEALGKDGKTIVNQDDETKAIAEMHYILTRFDQHNKQALDALKNWGE